MRAECLVERHQLLIGYEDEFRRSSQVLGQLAITVLLRLVRLKSQSLRVYPEVTQLQATIDRGFDGESLVHRWTTIVTGARSGSQDWRSRFTKATARAW